MSNGGWYRSCTWLDEASKREDLSGVFFSMIDAYLRRVDMSISAYLSELHKRATGKETGFASLLLLSSQNSKLPHS